MRPKGRLTRWLQAQPSPFLIKREDAAGNTSVFFLPSRKELYLKNVIKMLTLSKSVIHLITSLTIKANTLGMAESKDKESGWSH